MNAYFFYVNLSFQKENTSKKRCVYYHGDTNVRVYFVSLTLICNLPFLRRISLDTKISLLISQMPYLFE